MEELDIVEFIQPFEGIERGVTGTIVHIYEDAKAVEVELEGNKLVTVPNPKHYLCVVQN